MDAFHHYLLCEVFRLIFHEGCPRECIKLRQEANFVLLGGRQFHLLQHSAADQAVGIAEALQ